MALSAVTWRHFTSLKSANRLTRLKALWRDEVLDLHEHFKLGRRDALGLEQGLKGGQERACVLLGIPYLGDVDRPVDFARGVTDQTAKRPTPTADDPGGART